MRIGSPMRGWTLMMRSLEAALAVNARYRNGIALADPAHPPGGCPGMMIGMPAMAWGSLRFWRFTVVRVMLELTRRYRACDSQCPRTAPSDWSGTHSSRVRGTVHHDVRSQVILPRYFDEIKTMARETSHVSVHALDSAPLAHLC